MSVSVPPGKQTFLDPETGALLSLGTVTHYIPSTTTFKNTWADEAMSQVNMNPITLDATGSCSIWGDGLYRQILKDSTGNVIWDRETGFDWNSLLSGYALKNLSNVSIIEFIDAPTSKLDNRTSDIVSALNSGKSVVLPAGEYGTTQTLDLTYPHQSLICLPGAVIYPSGDFDAVSIRASFAVADVFIDGSDMSGGNGILITGQGPSVTTNYPDQPYLRGRIANVPGRGVSWRNGSFLRTDVTIFNCSEGFICESLFDANHGDIVAHITNCAGIGFRTVYDAVLTKQSSRHFLRYVKVFGCGGGGILIETAGNGGNLFVELNTGFQIRIDATKNGRANDFAILGANGYNDVEELVPVPGLSTYNGWAGGAGGGADFLYNSPFRTKGLLVKGDSSGSALIVQPTGTLNEFIVTNHDFSNTDMVLKDLNKDFAGGYRFIREVDVLRWRLGGGVITKYISDVLTFAVGIVPANGYVDVSQAFAGCVLGGVVTATSATAALPANITWTSTPNDAGGAVNLRIYNRSAAPILMGDWDFACQFILG